MEATKDGLALLPFQKALRLKSKIAEIELKGLYASDRAIGDVYRAALAKDEDAITALHDLRQEVIDFVEAGKYDSASMKFLRALVVKGDDKYARELIEKLPIEVRAKYGLMESDLKPVKLEGVALAATSVGAAAVLSGVGIEEAISSDDHKSSR